MSRRKVGNSERDRWLANPKRDTASGLLRGQSLDPGPRELKVTAARLSERRDEEVARLNSVLAEVPMWNELPRDAIRTLKDVLPVPRTERMAAAV